MEVRFSESSLEDLRSIREYICANNEEAAKNVVAHILEQLETILPHNSAIGRAGRVLRTREFVISKYPYIVPYQVRENTIYILKSFAYVQEVELNKMCFYLLFVVP